MSAVDSAAVPPAAVASLPIDVDTIDGTIYRALRISRDRLDPDQLAEQAEELRGHIALLLPSAREAASTLWRGSTEWYQRTARLDGIARQAEAFTAESPFAALVHVQLLARDCQWLVNQHTEHP